MTKDPDPNPVFYIMTQKTGSDQIRIRNNSFKNYAWKVYLQYHDHSKLYLTVEGGKAMTPLFVSKPMSPTGAAPRPAGCTPPLVLYYFLAFHSLTDKKSKKIALQCTSE